MDQSGLGRIKKIFFKALVTAIKHLFTIDLLSLGVIILGWKKLELCESLL